MTEPRQPEASLKDAAVTAEIAGAPAAPASVTVDQRAASRAAADPAPVGMARKPVTRGQLIRRRLLRKPLFWVGTVVVLGIALFAIFGNATNIYSFTDQDIRAFSKPPSAQHWFGTDDLGQDLYARVIVGLRKSLLIGLIAGPLATLIAALVGSVGGYLGGKVEGVINWFINLLLVLPIFYVLMVLSPLLSKIGWQVMVVFIALFGWMVTAQVVKSQTKMFRDREFVKAARFMGVGTLTTLRRHIIPNVASLLIIDACLGVNAAILSETALSFFGLGIQPPDVSLGTLLQDGQPAATTRPWLFIFPSIFLVALLTGVNLIGDALRDAVDPTSEVNRG